MVSDGRRTRLLLALVASSLLAATAARAGGPSAADRETARSLMQQGRELRVKGDLPEALKRFKAADDIMHVPTTGLEVARVQIALGQLVEARDTIAAIRQFPAKSSDPAPFTEARAKAEELDASLNGRVPSLTVAAKGATDLDQATLDIDGVSVPGKAVGLPRSVDPGHHVVTVKTPTAEGKGEVDIREGEQKQLEVALVATAAPPAEKTETPPAPTEPEVPEAPARSHAPGTVTWIGIGVAGAGVIAGAVTGYMSMSKKSSLDSSCANQICGPDSYSDLDTARTMATVADVAFAAAGVGAAVAIVSLVIGHEEASAPASQPPAATSLRVIPWLGLGGGGVRGTF
jgi:hypothetical protein